MRGQLFAEQAVAVRRSVRGTVTPADLERLESGAAADEADQAGREHDERERHVDRARHRKLEGGPQPAHRHQHSEQHVQGKPHREIQDDADHGGGDGTQRRAQCLVGAQGLDEGRAEEDPEKA
ncbi:MAG: hypothetical protein ABWY92_13505, partial [Xanthobacteraceae bacterium]